jgi:hypothetical protein
LNQAGLTKIQTSFVVERLLLLQPRLAEVKFGLLEFYSGIPSTTKLLQDLRLHNSAAAVTWLLMDYSAAVVGLPVNCVLLEKLNGTINYVVIDIWHIFGTLRSQSQPHQFSWKCAHILTK